MQSASPALKFVRSVWSSFLESSGLEPRLLQNLKLTHAEPGKVNFELTVEKQHTNRLGILHGGTIASMVDLGGSLAVASKGLYSTGVSTDINITYLASGGPVGNKVRAEVTCDRFGKTLAFTSIAFRNEEDVLFARGSHTKYVKLAWADERNIIDQLSPEFVKKP